MSLTFILCKEEQNVRIIICSDSHGNALSLKKIIENNKKAAVFVHLGDGQHEYELMRERYPDIDIRYVRGNNDYASAYPDQLVVDVPGARILCVHGHRHAVYYGTDTLLEIARNLECNVVCFGHTHRRYESYEDGIYILNPGSCSCPRDGKPPSYGFVDVTDNGIVINIVEV
jgi:putative phosphoesterase